MRKLLRTGLLLAPALCLAQASVSNTAATPTADGARIMSVQPTQTVSFEGSLAQLRERLQLTDRQLPEWARYQASVEAYSRLFFEEQPLAAYAAEVAPRQVELLAQRFQSRAAAIKEIERTVKPLYAVLNARQQKTADLFLMASIPVFGNPPGTR